MRELPVMLKPYEDEHYIGWIKRLAEENGVTEKELREHFFQEVREDGSLFRKGFFWLWKELRGFPDPVIMLKKHTSIMIAVRMQEKDIVAKRIHAFLYNSGQEYDTAGLPAERVKYCPDCITSDLAEGRTPYVRAWHQYRPVKICCKHKKRLIDGKDIDSEQGEVFSEKEMYLAKSAYEFYMDDSWEHLWEAEEKETQDRMGIVFRKNEVLFHYELCSDCGIRYLTTHVAMKSGRGCPVCEQHKDVVSYQLELKTDFEIIDTKFPKIKVRHKQCGHISDYDFVDFVWSDKVCEGCRNYIHAGRYKNHSEGEKVFKNALQEKFRGEYILIGEFRNSAKKTEFLHVPCGTISIKRPGDMIRNEFVKCKFCEVKKRLEESGDYILAGDYKGALKETEFIHVPCGTVFMQTPSRVLSGTVGKCKACGKLAMVVDLSAEEPAIDGVFEEIQETEHTSKKMKKRSLVQKLSA